MLLSASIVWYFSARPFSPEADVIPDQSITVDSDTRLYTVVVPRNLPQRPPLVFAFHGTGDSMQSMAAYAQLNRLASKEGFVLVYPATNGNRWDTRGASGDSKNIDLQFFDRLLARLVSQYNADPDRIYIVGMSNGGTFVQLLARLRSQQVAAAVSHSGTPPPPTDLPLHEAAPTLMIVGDLDPIHDSVVRSAMEHNRPLISVPGLAHQWSTRHNHDMWQFLSQFRRTPTQ